MFWTHRKARRSGAVDRPDSIAPAMEALEPRLLLTADLIVNSFTHAAGVYFPGQSITGTMNRGNQGTTDAGAFNVELHLSTDRLFGNLDDVTIEADRVMGGMPAMTAVIEGGAARVPTATPADNYYMILYLDTANEIVETNEINNMFVSDDPDIRVVRAEPYFSENHYLQMYPDVAAAVVAATVDSGYDHYVRFGMYEQRDPSAYFHERRYLQLYPDVAAAVASSPLRCGFEHYVRRGARERRNPSTFFNEQEYLGRNPDVLGAVLAGTLSCGHEHYIRFGQAEGRDPSSYFHEQSYRLMNADVRAGIAAGTWRSGLEHYLLVGARDRYHPSAFFDEQDYLTANPDVAAAVAADNFLCGYEHYLLQGASEGRLPANWWREQGYFNRNPDVRAAFLAGHVRRGYLHYIRWGADEGRSPNALLDEGYYLSRYPDVAAAVASGSFRCGVEHYMLYGMGEAREINRFFLEDYYARTYPDVAAAVRAGTYVAGFAHYYLRGAAERRNPSPSFSEGPYLDCYPDVAAAMAGGQFMCGLEHYILHGRAEGRLCPAGVPFAEGFETGLLGLHWQSYSSEEGRVLVRSDNGPVGRFHIGLDDIETNALYSLDEATLHVNLAGESRVVLRFRHKLGPASSDMYDAMPASFSGHADADGVAVSIDGGATWYRLWSDRPWTIYRETVVDVDAVLSSHGVAPVYSADTQFRFQQFGRGSLPEFGIYFDDVQVYAIEPVSSFPATEDFEAGKLGPAWETFSTGAGRARVTHIGGTHGGSYHLAMDDAPGSPGTALNEAIWHLDLAGHSGVDLSFWIKGTSENLHGMSDTFSASENSDGVAISVDGGGTWYRVWSDPIPDVYATHTVRLDDVLTAHAISDFAADTQIKFQQYGAYEFGLDGIYWDDITVTVS